MAGQRVDAVDAVMVALVEATGPYDAAVRLMAISGPDATTSHSDHETHDDFNDVRDQCSMALSPEDAWHNAAQRLGEAVFNSLTVPELALAVAYGVDDASHTSFSREWLEEHNTPFELAVGDLFPVQDMRLVLDTYSARPHNLGVPPGELPHVRRRTARPERVVIDPRFVDEIDGLLGGDAVRVAILLPNASLDDFDFNPFPVAPLAPEAQTARIVAAVSRAVDEGCRVVVAPECAVPPECLPDLCAAAARGSPPPILFAGSAHTLLDDARVNLAPVVLGAMEEPAWRQRKMSRFETSRDGQRITESIDIEEPPTLHVATGAHVRVAAMICKDILDAGRASLVGELGIHLLGVPAMSPSMYEFSTMALEVIKRSQGVMVVANNPLEWDGKPVTHGLMSRPTRNDIERVVRTGHATPPGLAVGVLQHAWAEFITT